MEVSAEVHFAQTLASNDKKFRDRALKRLKKYIGIRSSNGEGLSHDDFLKLWKGLHYCMWMQDKPLIQEELSQKIVSLLHAFPKLQDALRFVNVFFITEAREWTGIDRLRLDKFMLLIREMLRETFDLLSRNGWPEAECLSFSQNLAAVVMREDTVKIPYGIKMHLADIYVVELRKVPLDGMTSKKLTTLMFPFIYFLLKSQRRELARTVFDKTLKQVLQEFGKWAGQKAEAKSGKVEQVAEEADEGDDDSGEERDDEQDDDASEESDEEDMSAEEEEEGGGDDDDSDADMDVDDIDEKVTKKKKERYDLSALLRLMYKLAQDPKVDVKSRSYVYGIVKNYASKDATILQSSQDDRTKDDFDLTRVIQLTGESEKEDSDKKRRKRNQKRRREEEKMDAEDLGIIKKSKGKSEEPSQQLSDQISQPVNESEGKKRKRKRKKKTLDAGQNTPEAVNGNHLTSSKQKQISERVTAESNNNKTKKSDEIHPVDPKTEHTAPLLTSAKNNKKGKKRKRLSSDAEGETTSDEVVHIKKMKICGDNDLEGKKLVKNCQLPAPKHVDNKKTKLNSSSSPMKEIANLQQQSPNTTPNKQKKKKSAMTAKGGTSIEPQTDNGDVNTNARSSPLEKTKNKKSVPLSSPVECIIYKQTTPKTKPANLDKLSVSMTSPRAATTKFFVSDASPSRSSISKGGQSSGDLKSTPKSPATKGGVPVIPNNDKAAASSSTPQTTPTTPKESGIMGSLYDAVIKKAVGMVAPSTDPGVSREKAVTLPEQLTPGAQKKVVFDLRRNKANKFRDYLKTLASDPSPAFEPSKSPGQGILKSPSVESCASSSGGGSNNSTPTSRRQKGKSPSSKKKSKSPVLRGIF